MNSNHEISWRNIGYNYSFKLVRGKKIRHVIKRGALYGSVIVHDIANSALFSTFDTQLVNL